MNQYSFGLMAVDCALVPTLTEDVDEVIAVLGPKEELDFEDFCLALARVGLAHGAGKVSGEPDPLRALLVVISSSEGFAQAQRTPSRKSLHVSRRRRWLRCFSPAVAPASGARAICQMSIRRRLKPIARVGDSGKGARASLAGVVYFYLRAFPYPLRHGASPAVGFSRCIPPREVDRNTFFFFSVRLGAHRLRDAVKVEINARSAAAGRTRPRDVESTPARRRIARPRAPW